MDTYLGDIHLFPYGRTPYGWLLCDGTIQQIVRNQALYSLIGIKFGGDGKTTFALPNLLNDTPTTGMNYYIAASGIYPTRD